MAISQGYNKGQGQLVSRLSPVSTHNLSIPGPSRMADNDVRLDSAWFEAMNGIFWTSRKANRAADAFNFMSDATNSAQANPPFRVMDVWPMSAKRADAHRGKNY